MGFGGENEQQQKLGSHRQLPIWRKPTEQPALSGPQRHVMTLPVAGVGVIGSGAPEVGIVIPVPHHVMTLPVVGVGVIGSGAVTIRSPRRRPHSGTPPRCS